MQRAKFKKSILIDDKKIRDAIGELEDRIEALQNIKTLRSDASLSEVILAINKITNSVKKR